MIAAAVFGLDFVDHDEMCNVNRRERICRELVVVVVAIVIIFMVLQGGVNL